MIFPFTLDGINLKTNQTLIDPHEYEFEIHLHNHELDGKTSSHYRRRLHTVYLMRINISPFHF